MSSPEEFIEARGELWTLIEHHGDLAMVHRLLTLARQIIDDEAAAQVRLHAQVINHELQSPPGPSEAAAHAHLGEPATTIRIGSTTISTDSGSLAAAAFLAHRRRMGWAADTEGPAAEPAAHTSGRQRLCDEIKEERTRLESLRATAREVRNGRARDGTAENDGLPREFDHRILVALIDINDRLLRLLALRAAEEPDCPLNRHRPDVCPLCTPQRRGP